MGQRVLPAQFGETVEVGVRAHPGTAMLDASGAIKIHAFGHSWAAHGHQSKRPLRFGFALLETIVQDSANEGAHAHALGRSAAANLFGQSIITA